MKRTIKAMLIGAVIFMLLLPGSSFAQKITGGMKIGMNLSSVRGKEIGEMAVGLEEELKSKWGFSAGVFIRINISETFTIQPEVLYTTKGGKLEETILGETWKGIMDLSYLEIPVLVKFMIPASGGIKPSLFAGPSLAIKLSGKEKYEYGEATAELDLETMKNTDFGLIIGAGVDIGGLMFDLRYNLGLTSISVEEHVDVKNGAFSLMIGYSF